MTALLVAPDLGALASAPALRQAIGALLTVALVVAVGTLVVSAIGWAIAATTGNPRGVARARAGVLSAIGGAALAGAGITWLNVLIAVGRHL